MIVVVAFVTICQCRADTDRVFVDIGLGVYIEYTRTAALEFIAEREAVYSTCVFAVHVRPSDES